ncbi:hypothetical protein IKG16_01225 [Candidatus Saccharibacteria bacterium]|nr:hypothetical protein [Candidatus Saccharibacteria bacterium]
MKFIKSLAATAIAAASLAPISMANVSAISESEIQTISSVNVTVTPPTIGSTVASTTCSETYGEETYTWPCPDTKPTIIVPSDAHYSVASYSAYISGYPSTTENYDEYFIGTFAADTDYYVEVGLTPDEGWAFDITTDFDDNFQPIVTNNLNVNISGVVDYEENAWNHESQYMFYAKVRATAGGSSENSESTTTYATLEGGDQTFYTASDSNLTFRFNIDYNEFQESGEVYMDGEIVNSTNYTTKSGSTIITFTDSYTNSLSAGNHTLRVVTANGEASTTFTLKKSANPKTGLEITSNFVLLGTSLAGLAGAALYAKKASKNA